MPTSHHSLSIVICFRWSISQAEYLRAWILESSLAQVQILAQVLGKTNTLDKLIMNVPDTVVSAQVQQWVSQTKNKERKKQKNYSYSTE